MVFEVFKQLSLRFIRKVLYARVSPASRELKLRVLGNSAPCALNAKQWILTRKVHGSPTHPLSKQGTVHRHYAIGITMTM